MMRPVAMRRRPQALDRHDPRIHATDVATGEQRPFRLDRIEKAEVVECLGGAEEGR